MVLSDKTLWAVLLTAITALQLIPGIKWQSPTQELNRVENALLNWEKRPFQVWTYFPSPRRGYCGKNDEVHEDTNEMRWSCLLLILRDVLSTAEETAFWNTTLWKDCEKFLHFSLGIYGLLSAWNMRSEGKAGNREVRSAKSHFRNHEIPTCVRGNASMAIGTKKPHDGLQLCGYIQQKAHYSGISSVWR